jgi:hypothetical protein
MMNARKLLLTQLHLLRAQSFHRQLREAIGGDGRAERPAFQTLGGTNKASSTVRDFFWKVRPLRKVVGSSGGLRL